MNGIHEVSGSIPLGSTNEIKYLKDFGIAVWGSWLHIGLTAMEVGPGAGRVVHL